MILTGPFQLEMQISRTLMVCVRFERDLEDLVCWFWLG